MEKDPRHVRISSMLAGDRMWSLASLISLWLLYAFVFYAMLPYIGDPAVFWLLVVSGGLVILFNTAAVIAMIVHLSEDREEIYGLDLHYLDSAQNQDIDIGGAQGQPSA